MEPSCNPQRALIEGHPSSDLHRLLRCLALFRSVMPGAPLTFVFLCLLGACGFLIFCDVPLSMMSNLGQVRHAGVDHLTGKLCSCSAWQEIVVKQRFSLNA